MARPFGGQTQSTITIPFPLLESTTFCLSRQRKERTSSAGKVTQILRPPPVLVNLRMCFLFGIYMLMSMLLSKLAQFPCPIKIYNYQNLFWLESLGVLNRKISRASSGAKVDYGFIIAKNQPKNHLSGGFFDILILCVQVFISSPLSYTSLSDN